MQTFAPRVQLMAFQATVALAAMSLSVFAQNFAPDWVEESWRSARYPKSEWYTGFVIDIVKGQPDSKAYQAAEKKAQNKLSESIIINIQSVSATEQTSTQMQSGKNTSETINMNYRQEITSTSSTVLAKVDVKSYYDKNSGYIYAFAAVRKKDLADFYRSSISSIFAFADKEFALAKQLAEQGKKNSAFGRIQIIEDSLKTVSYWGSLLQAVESDNSYIKQEQDFWQKLSGAKKALERGTTVYLDISGIEDTKYLAGKLGAQMQEKQCNCTIAKNASNADYVVKIRIKLGNCIENALNKFGEIYCYANANVSVNNLKYKKPLDVKIPEAKGGWGNSNREKATDMAIEELTNNIAEKIIQSIDK
jgi:hypothetical protein